MMLVGKLLIGLALLGGFITLLIASERVRYAIINIIKTYWIFPVILVLLAIFANKWFMLLYSNATKIGVFIICLGIVGIGSSTGRKMVVVGGIIALIGYFFLQIPLY